VKAAWLSWAARVEEGGAVAAIAASREGGRGAVFRLSEEEESMAADKVGPPGSDKGRAGGCWASLWAVGREEGGRLLGGGP
jgi:hypothetical protein